MLSAERDRHHIADEPLALGDRPRDPRELAGVVRDLDAVGAVEHGPASLRLERGSLWGCIYHAVAPGPPSPDPVPPLRRLLPDPALVPVRELLEELNLGASALTDRPYTIVNFVASADGHATFQGRSRFLSDDADRELFHGLREHVDAVLAGIGTLRTEGYGRIVRDPERRHRRAASGLRPGSTRRHDQP